MFQNSRPLQQFFPAAGDLLSTGSCGTWIEWTQIIAEHSNRGYTGYYWTSTTYNAYSNSLILGKSYDNSEEEWYYQLRIKDDSARASGFSVRCIKE